MFFIHILETRTDAHITDREFRGVDLLQWSPTALCHCGWRPCTDGWCSAWGKHNVWHLCQMHNHWVPARVLPALCRLSAPLIWAECIFPICGCSRVISALCFPDESIKQTKRKLLYFYTEGYVTPQTRIGLSVLLVIPHSCVFWTGRVWNLWKI